MNQVDNQQKYKIQGKTDPKILMRLQNNFRARKQNRLLKSTLRHQLQGEVFAGSAADYREVEKIKKYAAARIED
jgi:hypothetical protein